VEFEANRLVALEKVGSILLTSADAAFIQIESPWLAPRYCASCQPDRRSDRACDRGPDLQTHIKGYLKRLLDAI